MEGTGVVTTDFNYSPVRGPNPLSCRIRVKISKRYNVRFFSTFLSILPQNPSFIPS